MSNIGAVGSEAQFGFAEETVWASGTPTINKFIPFLSESLALERNVVMTDSIRGGTARSIWREGAERTGGDLNVEVQPVGMYTLFKHALGRVATAGPSGAGDHYVHDIYPSGALPDGLRLEIGRTGVAGGTFTYRGCKVNQMVLNCSVGEPLTATFSFLGKDESTSPTNPTAATVSGLNPLTFDEGVITVDGNSQDVAGFSLTINNNLTEDKGALGSRYRVAIPRTGFRDVTGSLNLEFDNLDMYTKYTGGTETALKLKFTSDDLIGAGSQAHILEIDCPRIVFTGTTPVVGGPDLIYYDMPFVALYDEDQGDGFMDEVKIKAITSDTSI